jgi:hypothetical protein
MKREQGIRDFRTLFRYRREIGALQRERDRAAPKVGDLAPDFSLPDSTGTHTVTLSDYRGRRPVALIFGSFT